MHGLRNQFFARPALTGHQHRDVRARNGADRVDDLPHRLRARDDPLEPFVLHEVLEFLGFAPQHRLLRGSLNHRPQHDQIQRLLDKVKRAVLERIAGGRDIAVGGDHDGLRVGLILGGEFQDSHPCV